MPGRAGGVAPGGRTATHTESTLYQYFGRQLIDRNVEILDPAAGTGTFIVELIEHFRGQPAKLRYKYREELHANEIAILPYYPTFARCPAVVRPRSPF
jgi:predicted helicase